MHIASGVVFVAPKRCTCPLACRQSGEKSTRRNGPIGKERFVYTALFKFVLQRCNVFLKRKASEPVSDESNTILFARWTDTADHFQCWLDFQCLSFDFSLSSNSAPAIMRRFPRLVLCGTVRTSSHSSSCLRSEFCSSASVETTKKNALPYLVKTPR